MSIFCGHFQFRALLKWWRNRASVIMCTCPKIFQSGTTLLFEHKITQSGVNLVIQNFIWISNKLWKRKMDFKIILILLVACIRGQRTDCNPFLIYRLEMNSSCLTSWVNSNISKHIQYVIIPGKRKSIFGTT